MAVARKSATMLSPGGIVNESVLLHPEISEFSRGEENSKNLRADYFYPSTTRVGDLLSLYPDLLLYRYK